MKFTLAIAALAAVAAPILASTDIREAGAPEATPLVEGRMFENLDETHYISARSAANVEAEDSSSAAIFAAAGATVFAAVGVAGFVAYKKRSSPAESSMALDA